MAKLERRAELRWKKLQERIEPRQVLLEIGRQLEQQRAEFRPERAGDPQEITQILLTVAQAGIVRDAFGSLESQPEALRSLLGPPGENLLVGHPIEGVVDLDTRESFGIKRQHL